MNDIELNILLNELHLNNLLLKKVTAVEESHNDLEKFLYENKSIKINVTVHTLSDIVITQISKYSLFLIDKIIDMTDKDGKHIYNRKDLMNL